MGACLRRGLTAVAMLLSVGCSSKPAPASAPQATSPPASAPQPTSGKVTSPGDATPATVSGPSAAPTSEAPAPAASAAALAEPQPTLLATTDAEGNDPASAYARTLAANPLLLSALAGGATTTPREPFDHTLGKPLEGYCELKGIDWASTPNAFGLEHFMQVEDRAAARAHGQRSYAILKVEHLDLDKDKKADLAVVALMNWAPRGGGKLAEWGEIYFFGVRGCRVGSVLVVKSGPAPCRKASDCCKICETGRACGNTCIQATLRCKKPHGCACNADDLCP